MADKAHIKTDRKLAEMEKHLSAIYSRAKNEVEKKALVYLEQFMQLDEQKQKLVADGKISEDQYLQWRRNKILYGKRWENLKKQLAIEYANVNRKALEYVNDQLPGIYSINFNESSEMINAQSVKIGGGYSFDLVDENTVKRLATKDKTLLPYKYLNGVKDVRWNTQKVNSSILQGILQGDSIPNIAKRLGTVTEMNRASAIRNARTAVTGAECRGRQDSYEKAEESGIHLKREWISAIDGRTRHSHRLLDGQLVDVDKPFKSELGDIMFPGDQSADPANVYNCRCTIAAKVISIGGVKVEGSVNENDEKADRKTAQDFYNENPKEFDIRQKMLYNKKADKDQLAAYKKRLGPEAPRKFSDFQDMKYRDTEKYAELKQYYRYKVRVPEAKKEDFEIAKRIKEKGIVGTIRVPAAKIEVSNLSVVNEHAFRHGCTLEDAKEYIKNAKVSITRTMWDGLHTNYYSVEGAVYLNSEKKINTIYSSENFKGDTLKIIEEII